MPPTIADIEINLPANSRWGRQVLADTNEFLGQYGVSAYWRTANRQRVLTVRVPEAVYTDPVTGPKIKEAMAFLRDYFLIAFEILLTREPRDLGADDFTFL